MTRRQTILGFFDNAAEAQQAVQLLLAKDFTPENISLSTRTGFNPAAGDGLTAPAEAGSSSGRFFRSLFGDREAVQVGLAPFVAIGSVGRIATNGLDYGGPGEKQVAPQRGTWVTVRVQSITEAKQAAELLNTAGAGSVAADERPDLTS